MGGGLSWKYGGTLDLNCYRVKVTTEVQLHKTLRRVHIIIVDSSQSSIFGHPALWTSEPHVQFSFCSKIWLQVQQVLNFNLVLNCFSFYEHCGAEFSEQLAWPLLTLLPSRTCHRSPNPRSPWGSFWVPVCPSCLYLYRHARIYRHFWKIARITPVFWWLSAGSTRYWAVWWTGQ